MNNIILSFLNGLDQQLHQDTDHGHHKKKIKWMVKSRTSSRYGSQSSHLFVIVIT